MTIAIRCAVALLLLAGCEYTVADFDNDGTPDDSDCGPDDPTIYPGAEDWYGDDIDQNCDGEDGLDVDGDGDATAELGGPDCDDGNASISTADNDGDGVAGCSGDCDDGDANRAPNLPEICDGSDNDCDSELPIDEQDPDEDTIIGCAGDCAPTDGDVFPGAPEACDALDSDCDGSIVDEDLDTDSDDEPDCVDPDDDGDGSADGEDCEPLNPLVHPGADEGCNGVDDDCDGAPDASELDTDADGFAPCEGDCDDTTDDRSPTTPEVCDGLDNDCDGTLPENEQDLDADGMTGCEGDCGPQAAEIFLGAPETCDAVDSDCDGSIVDEDVDTDSDDVPDCVDQDDDNDGSLDGDDCEPLNAAIHPAAAEVCNGIDDDCDTVLPDNELDGDGDGYAPCDGDCDDADPTAFLGFPEVCNGLDDDCDGYVPSNELDADEDGFTGCDGDCNDGSDTVFPGATELCNRLDDDCDGLLPADEIDDDGDTFTECEGDCDEGDADIYPRTDVWEDPNDNLDSNCDGLDGTSASSAWAWFEGDAPFDNLGATVCAVPDIDLDGVPEIAIGAPFANTTGPNAGKLYVVSGASLQPGENDILAAMASISGSVPGDEFGWSVSGGDFDGDGRAEVLTGSYLNDDVAQWAGKAYLFGGATLAAGGALEANDAMMTVSGDYWWDFVGWAATLTGDVDGDGRPDLVTSGYEANPPAEDAGRTTVWRSSASRAPGDYLLSQGDVHVDGTELWESSGYWVAHDGHLDGDGLHEMLIGARYADGAELDAGRAYLVTGAQLAAGSLWTTSAHATFVGQGLESRFGWHVQFLGDIDGDGLDEIGVSGPWYDGGGTDRGALAFWWGSTVAAGGTFDVLNADLFFEGTEDFARFGHSAARAGDVDGDGTADLIITEPSTNAYSNNGGYVHLFFGSGLPTSGTLSGADADVTFEGDFLGAGLGRYLCPGTDLNGDGKSDLLLGAQWHPGSSTLEGRAFVFLSPY